MKIVYMGTPDFAVGALEAIIKAGHEVVAVVTQPDKKKGRGGSVAMSPVKLCAMKYQIPVFQPVRIKDEEAVAQLKKYDAEIFVVAAFGQILSKEILDMPKYGCVNIHASLLPKYRGAAPIQWAILDGEKTTGVTIQQMNEGIDTGDILIQEEVELDPKETGESLFDKLAICGADLIVKLLPMIEDGDITKVPQSGEFSYAKMLHKQIGVLDFNDTAKVLERKIRGLNSWPSAYTTFKGKTLKIWDADVVEYKEKKFTAGTVIEVTKNSFTILTSENGLKINEVQLEGKKRMDVAAFLLGNNIEIGMVFPS